MWTYGFSADFRHKKRLRALHTALKNLVGMARFERAVSASRTQRSTRLSHIPNEETLVSQGNPPWQALFRQMPGRAFQIFDVVQIMCEPMKSSMRKKLRRKERLLTAGNAYARPAARHHSGKSKHKRTNVRNVCSRAAQREIMIKAPLTRKNAPRAVLMACRVPPRRDRYTAKGGPFTPKADPETDQAISSFAWRCACR